MMGITTFDAASLSADRRTNRINRRRLHRRQQRVQLLQEVFAKEITSVDPHFFTRLRESALWREDKSDPADPNALFNDDGFTDKEYHNQYPTIHHLIYDLMQSTQKHDVRLVYIACAWLVAHRGHFLSPVKEDNIREVVDITIPYQAVMAWFEEEKPWVADPEAFGAVLKKRQSIRDKEKEFYSLLYEGKKPIDLIKNPDDPDAFVVSRSMMLRLLCGGRVAPKDLFPYKADKYADLSSFSLGGKEEELEDVLPGLEEDGELVIRLKALYDWAVLSDILRGETCISAAKIKTYEQHKRDLKWLKLFIRKYTPDQYDKVFTLAQEGNYPAYTDHPSVSEAQSKIASKAEFSDFLKKIVRDLSVDEEDRRKYDDMMARLDANTFLPKQKDTDNRVIPYQLYAVELRDILKRAAAYLPFLSEKDDNGWSAADKIAQIFRFRIPYFVGPLNAKSDRAWLSRKEGRITPWNFTEMVDLDASENAFIRNLTGRCTYLPGEPVAPANALFYARFTVLNELNTLKINSVPITVAQKQAIYNDVFCKCKKPTVKALRNYCISEGFMLTDGILSGIDTEGGIKASLAPYFSFKRLMKSGALLEEQVDRIIERITCTEDQIRLRLWLDKQFPGLSEEDRKYISRLKFKDFGRMSRHFLCELQGVNKQTGEICTVLQAMWENNDNLMQVLDSEKYTFAEVIREEQRKYYCEQPSSLDKRMDELYLSNAVRRPIYRTLDIVKDVVKATGHAPKKIFVEMARGGAEDVKGKRTKSRRIQLQELYKNCAEAEVRELAALLESKTDNELQSEKLYLYFMQLGRCMYSGKSIDLEYLNDNKYYDVDHIFPQCRVKDDSILNNKVLVLSKYNGDKSDTYPVPAQWRQEMYGYWKKLRENNLITEEKFRRLTRATPFTDAEKYGFIERQLVETRQSTKAITALLQERYPDTEIVYVKAGLVSEFRHEYDLLKSRTVNDLHHAKDAYLNIVVGNIYHERFNRNFFRIDQEYSLNTKQVFGRPVYVNGTCFWKGESDLGRIKSIVQQNHIHVTRYAFCRKGQLFDQMPLKAAEDSELLPRKKDLPVERYGGYRKPTASFFVLAKFFAGKKSDIMIAPVELLREKEFEKDPEATAKEAVEKVLGKAVDRIELPIGARKLKVNTVFSVDGFRFALAGKSGGGVQLGISPLAALKIDANSELYLKRLESFINKKAKNKELKIQQTYDKISAEENIKMYDLFQSKLSSNPFSKRPANVSDAVEKGKERFESLPLEDQVTVLEQILLSFGRSGGGSDLKLIGGVAKAGVPKLSSSLSNWKKNYTDVRIIDQSASGLFEKQSVNLLELL